MSELLTTADAAAYLRVVPETVRKMVRSGRLQHIRCGRNFIRFTPEHIQQFVEEHMVAS